MIEGFFGEIFSATLEESKPENAEEGILFSESSITEGDSRLAEVSTSIPKSLSGKIESFHSLLAHFKSKVTQGHDLV